MFTKIFLLLALLVASPLTEKQKADLTLMSEKAYLTQNYCDAIAYYDELINTHARVDGNMLLNQAHAYYLTYDTSKAIETYTKVLLRDDAHDRSIAFQQLGVITYERRDLDSALLFFKKAIQSDHHNTQARYDYELVKKLICQKAIEDVLCKRDCSKSRPSKKPGEPTEEEVDLDGPWERVTTLPPGKIEQLLTGLEEQELVFLNNLKRLPHKELENHKPDW